MKINRCFFFVLICIPLLLVNNLSKGQESESNNALNPDREIFFPRGFGIVVNQVGYMEGSSLDHEDGPWRAGIRRSFDVRDYKPIAEVGEAAGIRFMSLFALAEMDRLNVVATLPHARQEGTNFDNSANIGPQQIEIMDYVKSNAAHIELGVTGVGHEWWVDGVKTRSEWYDFENAEPRPENMMRRHMDVIKNILGQYGISEEQGHSFPESFSALGYYWNPGESYSTGRLFSDYGAKYVSTKFNIIPELNPPPEKSGGMDNGVLVLDRGIYGNIWHNYADIPSDPVETYEADIIDSHWANWLAADDFLQPELNEEWIEYFRGIQAYPYRYLAKNSQQLYSQWLYKKYTQVEIQESGKARIDNRAMPDDPYNYDLLGNMVVSIPLKEGLHVSDASINGNPVAAYFEEAGYGFIYLPKLKQEAYDLTWSVGERPVRLSVNNSGTYNVLRTNIEDRSGLYEIQMYGTQKVRFRVPAGYEAQSDHPQLRVLDQNYDHKTGELVVTVKGHDIQGETGIIRVGPAN